ncbi:hypothetical protein PMAYCL1PPCAC_23038, partial [Pristionchus mayeri]
MNILSLPDLVIREILKRVEFKDRLGLRATCRALEKLVAESNGGHFNNGRIFHLNSLKANPYKSRRLKKKIGTSSLTVYSTHGTFTDINLTVGGFQLLQRLFSRISFGELEISLSDSISIYMSICELLKKFSIRTLNFELKSSIQFEMALDILKSFPDCKYRMHFYGVHSSIDKFGALPPAEELKLIFKHKNDQGSSGIPTHLFYALLSSHRNLCISDAILNSRDFKKILEVASYCYDLSDFFIEIISADVRGRKVKLLLAPQTIANWLRDYGISTEVEEGDHYGEVRWT